MSANFTSPRREVDLGLKDPGFPVEIVVSADLRTLTRVWMGDVRLAETVRGVRCDLDHTRRIWADFVTEGMAIGFPVD